MLDFDKRLMLVLKRLSLWNKRTTEWCWTQIGYINLGWPGVLSQAFYDALEIKQRFKMAVNGQKWNAHLGEENLALRVCWMLTEGEKWADKLCKSQTSHEIANSEANILENFPNLTWRITEKIFNFKKKEGEHPWEL